MKNKGFTLIELLVVISIIALLSTVVMASLQIARTKAQEAAIKSDLQSIKTQAELEYSKTGDYSNVSTAIAPMLAHINNNGGTTKLIFSNYLVTGNGIDEGYTRYSVSVKLNSNPTKNWSVSNSYNVSVWDVNDGNNGNYVVWSNAMNFCENSGGRLPTIEELISLWYVHGKRPPNMEHNGEGYWTSTFSKQGGYIGVDYVWVVNMWDSTPFNSSQDTGELYKLRCIR